MEQYVKYLQKSRFDRDYAELNIEETVKRHENICQGGFHPKDEIPR